MTENESRNTDDQSPITDYWSLITVFLIAGGLATLLSFRIFQPYAFDGLGLNLQWISNIAEQRAQAAGSDLPWNLQWARRSHLYSFTNLTTWGLGLPLGILAWAGFLLMGWRIIKGEWKHLLLWGWTAFYFLWQSLQFNPTMRYQLPIYPLLGMMAAWFIFELREEFESRPQTRRPSSIVHCLHALIGVTVLISTAVWAFAFQSIYLRDEPRIAASRWIFQNAPGPVNLRIETVDSGIYNQPLPVASRYVDFAWNALYPSILSQIQRTNLRGGAWSRNGFLRFALDHCADFVFGACPGYSPGARIGSGGFQVNR